MRCRHTSSALPSPGLSPGIRPGVSLTKTMSMPPDLSLSQALFINQYLSMSLLPFLCLWLCLAFNLSLFLLLSLCLLLLLFLFLFFRSISYHNCHTSFARSMLHFIPAHMPDDSYLILRPDVRDSLQSSRGPRSWQCKRWPGRACDICLHNGLHNAICHLCTAF